MRIPRLLACILYAATFATFALVAQVPRAAAQSRVNDKDVQSMMRNVRDDAKSFRMSFDSAVKHSTIRKTSQAKDARHLVATFERQTNEMYDRFKKHHQGGGNLDAVLNTAGQIDSLVYSVQFGPEVNAKWQKIREELHPIAAAYNLPEHFRNAGSGTD